MLPPKRRLAVWTRSASSRVPTPRPKANTNRVMPLQLASRDRVLNFSRSQLLVSLATMAKRTCALPEQQGGQKHLLQCPLQGHDPGLGLPTAGGPQPHRCSSASGVPVAMRGQVEALEHRGPPLSPGQRPGAMCITRATGHGETCLAA